jgi:hypothetical protein
MGRIGLHVALDCPAFTLETFIIDTVEPGSVVATDGLRSYEFLDGKPYIHEITNQSRA